MSGLRLSDEERRELQISELDILRELGILCDRHGLRYYLTAGTLLGAVRHKGFIPWDDDIDIAMPRSDYDKLRRICEEELPEQYYYQDSYTEINFPYFFSKIRKKGTEVYEPHLAQVDIQKGHYIDIFPLDVCPQNKRAGQLFFKLVGLFSAAYTGKVDRTFRCGYSKKYMRFLYWLLHGLPLTWLRAGRRGVCGVAAMVCRKGCLCTVGGAHGYPAETYRDPWFSSCVDVMFEGEHYPAPLGWHELLTNMYGNYHVPPPDCEKVGHFTKKPTEEISI